jgi:NADPH-dependent 2,4-dienoyl-CoA reductase/sulfur reductase-like enzyme
MELIYDVAVIGGGPAGLSAAAAARQEGARVALLERDRETGGILNQCVHHGFGLLRYGENMTGPELSHRLQQEVAKLAPDIFSDTTVLSIGKDDSLLAVNPALGVLEVRAKSTVLAMGCRERTRPQVMIPGTRPAGVYTAGAAQRLVNMAGVMPGERIVILGSGDIGLIMARRFTLEGAKVLGVFEVMPRAGGLIRNVVQCLEDYAIPLYLQHTVTQIHGRKRVSGVTVSAVDPACQPLPGSERFIACDTLILSVGLIPENELSQRAGILLDPVTGGPRVDSSLETSRPGFFAAGNGLQVHDLVDHVIESSRLAGQQAARRAQGLLPHPREGWPVTAGTNISRTVPQIIRRGHGETTLYLRVKEEARNVDIVAVTAGRTLLNKKEKAVRPPEMLTLTLPPGSVTGPLEIHALARRGKA